MVDRHDDQPLTESFWVSPEIACFLRTCDVPAIMSAVRKARGWSQARLGEAIGYSQAWVSKVVSGSQPVTLDQAREILRRLGAPLHMVRLGEQEQGGDDPTHRRDVLRSAALAGLALPLPPPRGGGGLDDTTPASLRAITGAQRRLDATMPSHELAEPVNAHFRLARQLADESARDLRPNLAAAASEAAGFAAWLHFDMQDLGTARRYYRRAVSHAAGTGHDLLTGYMLGSLASFEIETGDPVRGLTLLNEAGNAFGGTPPPAAAAWLSSNRALGLATEGKATDAHRCLRAAASASRRQETEAPWPWVFPFDQGKVAGYQALCAVRLARPREALATFADSQTPRSPKQAALIELERADAHLQLDQRDEAFSLARHALATGQSAQSERVVRRAAQLRRGYKGSTTAALRAFDTQLRHATV